MYVGPLLQPTPFPSLQVWTSFGGLKVGMLLPGIDCPKAGTFCAAPVAGEGATGCDGVPVLLPPPEAPLAPAKAGVPGP